MPRSSRAIFITLLLAWVMGYGCSDSSTTPESGEDPISSADLRITKTAADDGTPAVGETVTYTLSVSNAGPGSATGVAVLDSLPDGVSFVSASNGGTESGGVVTWTAIPTLASGSQTSFTVTAALTEAGSVTNVGVVASSTPDPSSANNRATAQVSTVVSADISLNLTTTDDGSPAITETLTYDLLVANAGPSPASNLVVTDTLPTGVTFASATGSGEESGGVVTWDTIPTLAAGTDTTLTVTVTIASAGSLTNKGAVTAATPDPVPENNADAGQVEAAALSIFPSSGPPGAVIRIAGLDLTGVETEDLRVYLGGEEAPVRRDEADYLYTGIPLFLNQAGQSSPPGDPVDLVLKEGEQVLLSENDAVTVLPLPQVPGEAEAVAEELQQISSSLQTILQTLGLQPGREEQYFLALFAGLDSLIRGSDENSLASTLQQVQAGSPEAELLNGLLGSMGASQHLARFAEDLQSLATQAQLVAGRMPASAYPSLPPSPGDPAASFKAGTSPSRVALQVGDDLLALKMQIYVVLRGWGEEVIGPTNATFQEWLGTFAGLAAIARAVPLVDLSLLIMNYIDFVVNKVIVGLFPSSLDAIDLQLQTNEFETNQRTNASITVRASNEPPPITLQYMISNVIGLMGVSPTSSWVESFEQALVRTATFFLNTARNVLLAYDQAHPELDADVDLFSFIPHISWQSQGATASLYDLQTLDSDIVEPVDGELDWQTKDETGLGRIFVRPSFLNDARLLPGYFEGAFGTWRTESPTRSVIVGSDLELEVTVPAAMEHGEAGDLEIRAGYRVQEGGVDWTSNILIEILVENGSVDLDYGTTDEDGEFTTTLRAPESEDVSIITLIIEAKGEDDAFAGNTVEIALGAGLPAYYSNGAEVKEGPINHGWSNDCPTEYKGNFYQNVCTPISESPVYWANSGDPDGDNPENPDTRFQVYWSGYLFTPVEGEYRFGGWFEGIAYVEVNGVPVFRIHDGSISGAVYLPAETWVPIYMTFESTGYSNWMSLYWNLPGPPPAELVPRKYLSGRSNSETAASSPAASSSNVTVIRRY